MEFIEEARKRIAEEERVKRIQEENDKRLQKEQEAASAAAVQEQMILLESEKLRIELEARQLVIEREAQRLAAEKEAAIASEMERLRKRSPLEKLQDDFEELKRQMEAKEVKEAMETKKAKEVVVVKVAKPVLKKETLKESWEALLEWQHWKKMYEDASKAWSVHEHTLLQQKDLFKYGFSGKVDGTIQQAYPLSEVSAELQKTQEELNTLQSRYTVHKVSYQKAMKDTQEAKQNHMSRFHSHNHPDFTVPNVTGMIAGGSHIDQTKRATVLAELQKKIDVCVAVESQMKILADKEENDWKENKEKNKLDEKIRYLTPLKTSYKNVVKSFEFITCYNEHYTKAAWNAKMVTGMEDLELAWQQAFDLIVRARSA